jgi:anti-sigma factor RsiW
MIVLPSDEMTCRELVDLVTAYLDGTLPEGERARFDAHLESCPYCGIYIEQMRQAVRLLGQLTEDTIDPRARDALLMQFAGWKRG